MALKDFTRAKEAFQESVQINPFYPEVHVGLAKAYAMLGEDVGTAKERDIAHRLSR